MIKDWLFNDSNKDLYNSSSEPTRNDDLKALGKIMAMTATLLPLD